MILLWSTGLDMVAPGQASKECGGGSANGWLRFNRRWMECESVEEVGETY